MLPHELRRYQPQPLSVETWDSQRVSRDFYQEVAYRQAHERHCEWYNRLAKQHRQEVIKMQRDVNLLGWFTRFRR